jgi:hypothetical protein
LRDEGFVRSCQKQLAASFASDTVSSVVRHWEYTEEEGNMFRSIVSVIAISAAFATVANSAVIVNVGASPFTTAITTAGGSGANTNTLQPNPAINQGAGLTMNFTITPGANDVAGTVLLAEIGGTSNGTGLYLVNGVPTLISKPSAGNATVTPSGLNDTNLADKTLAVQAGNAPLLAGTSYSLAAVYDLAGAKARLAYTADGSNFVDSAYTFTNTAGATNWNGNNSLSIVVNSLRQDGNPLQGYRGGLSEDINSGVFYAGSSVDGTGGVKDFTGSVSQAALWNAVGTIVVPEPVSLALLAVSLTAARRRRS